MEKYLTTKKKLGFKSHREYEEYLAKQRGFGSIREYREHLAKQRGFKSYAEYKEHLAKQRGFKSYTEYQEYWKQKEACEFLQTKVSENVDPDSLFAKDHVDFLRKITGCEIPLKKKKKKE